MRASILIASRNPGKIKEISEILSSLDLSLISLIDLSLGVDPQETGSSYAENARLKAIAYRDASGLPALADDSGLEVDVLIGAPGIHSARFSNKPGASDADRRAFLLEKLQIYPIFVDVK